METFRKQICLLTAWFLCMNVTAKVVTVEIAADLASNFLTSKGLSPQKLMLCQEQTDTKKLRAAAEAPAYYIFCGEENQAMVIVSGDDIAKPILGYSYNVDGNNNVSFPPAMKSWLNEMESQILKGRKEVLLQSEEVARQWRAASLDSKEMRLTTAHWGQEYPYNQDCPLLDNNQCVTGCVATAYAIVMKYYGYPKVGSGVTRAYTCPQSGVNVSERDLSHPYDWKNMPLSGRGGYSSEEIGNIAQLMADIGADIQVDYSTDVTAGYYGKGSLFSDFGYDTGVFKFRSDSTAAGWNAMLRNEIDNGRPVLYIANSFFTNEGHAFIIDGYKGDDYFYINWGWGGYYNGAFALDAMIVDDLIFNGHQVAYVGFQPANDSAAVAVVDGKAYYSLQAAMNAVPNNGQQTVVTLQKDFALNKAWVDFDQNVLLDLNGCSVTIEDYGLFNYGILEIIDSKDSARIELDHGNTQVIRNYGNLTIRGGEFVNLSVSINENDCRRVIWADEGSTTNILGGKFECNYETLNAHGELVIDGGELRCHGNASVLMSRSTSGNVIITGGLLENDNADGIISEDYRRAVWTGEGTTLEIHGGSFITNSQSQTICVNGDGTIDGASIENKGTGIGCASNGNLVIKDCMLSATVDFYTWSGATLTCLGGIYSKKVTDEYLAEGCFCASNNDMATLVKYPFRVSKITGISTLKTENSTAKDVHYDLNGRVCSESQPGIHIVRKSDGRSVKMKF